MASERVIQEIMMFPFEFISPTEVTIEETAKGVAMISGTLLREGESANGNVYTISEMEKIAKQAEGMDIYVGVTTKIDPNLGIPRKNMHDNIEKNKVGKIIRTVFNKAKRIIKYWAQLVNTKQHPTIIQEVKAGWGISIGGVAKKARIVFNEAMSRILTLVKGMKLDHIQLLPPYIKRGQEEAKVENVEIRIQESMIFDFDEAEETYEIEVGFGISEIEIN